MKRKETLKYLRTHKCGSLKDLIDISDKEIVKGFELTGIIKRGQEPDRSSSYEFTDEGLRIDKYANLDNYYKPTILDKIQNFINKKTIIKNSLSI